MARAYKRDKNGRFASSGGGGKLGKSEKNDTARARYKKAASEARVAEKSMAKRKERGTVDAFAKSESKRAKSNLTRVTNQLTGKKGRKAAAPAKPAAPKNAAASKSSSIEAARAAGRKKGLAIAAKTAKRNAELDRKAKRYGG